MKGGVEKKTVVFFLFTAILYFSMSAYRYPFFDFALSNQKLIPSDVPDYYIFVNSDQDFINYGFPGNGTKGDPYRIENLHLDLPYKTAIYIANTKAYFNIHNNTIENTIYEGIVIDRVKNGTGSIQKNLIQRCFKGIWIHRSSGIYVYGNKLQYNIITGIQISDATKLFLHNNVIYHSQYGITMLYNCTYSEFRTTVIISNREYGIHINENNYNLTFFNNLFLNNGYSLENSSQVLSNNKTISWLHNYFSESDGYEPYKIDGLGNNIDVEPLRDAPDTDGDGVIDWIEIRVGTDPIQNDTSGDGLIDFDELTVYFTDPLDLDTDDDGMPDAWEVEYGINPLINDADQDPDNDGLINIGEYYYGTDPFKEDTDGDGFSDGLEIKIGADPLNRWSNPITYYFLRIAVPIITLAGGAFLAFNRIVKVKKENNSLIKIYLEKSQVEYNKWEDLIERVQKVTEEHKSDIIFEIGDIQKKNELFIQEMVVLIEKAKRFLRKQIIQASEEVFQRFKDRKDICLKLQENLLKSALKSLHTMSKNSIQLIVKDFLWGSYLQTHMTKDHEENRALVTIQEYSQFERSSLYIKFHEEFKKQGNSIEEKIEKEISSITDQITAKLKDAEELHTDLLELEIKDITIEVINNFDKLKSDLIKCMEDIQDIEFKLEDSNFKEEKIEELQKTHAQTSSSIEDMNMKMEKKKE